MKLRFWKRKPLPSISRDVDQDLAEAIQRARQSMSEAHAPLKAKHVSLDVYVGRLERAIERAIEAAGNDRNRASVKRMLAILEGAIEK